MELTKIVRIFDENRSNTQPRLFDEVSGILFWDDINNQTYYEIYKEMREVFWIPEETSMAQDKNHWVSSMKPKDKELFYNGISVLAVLDSIAAYFDKIASDYIRDSAVKAIMATTGFFETIHNESYTYIISSLEDKSRTKEVFERPKNNPLLLKRNKLMMDLFDDFLAKRDVESFAKALVAMAGLEGLCFVNGFTPFYHFNRNEKMFGTGTLIQFIQRDEIKHSYFQTVLVRDIMTQYPEINTKEFSKFVYHFFLDLVECERAFCDELYKDHSDIDTDEIKEYVGFRANLILDNLGLDKIFPAKKNPMPWITAFDPDKANNVKSDFFEDKETNYTKPSEASNGWDEL